MPAGTSKRPGRRAARIGRSAVLHTSSAVAEWTTDGYHEQFFEANGTVNAYDTTVAGSDNVNYAPFGTSPPAGSTRLDANTLFFLWVDAAASVFPDGRVRIGLGVVILFLNAALLTGYSLSCHSLRHVVGGKLDCFSCSRRAQVRHGMWKWLTAMNRHHMAWAWASLITVTLADVYVRALALGILTDPAIRL